MIAAAPERCHRSVPKNPGIAGATAARATEPENPRRGIATIGKTAPAALPVIAAAYTKPGLFGCAANARAVTIPALKKAYLWWEVTETRLKVLEAFTAFGDRSVIPFLLNQLEKSSLYKVQIKILETLGILGTIDDIERLLVLKESEGLPHKAWSGDAAGNAVKAARFD